MYEPHTEIPAIRDVSGQPGSRSPNGTPASVLIVDDSPSKLASLEAVLAGTGLDVVTANSGREALRQLLTRDFAVVLLDVNMPGLDGFETATLIHNRPRSSHTPIIFVTAEADSEAERYKGYTLGAVDYVYSPIVPEVLRAKVQVFVNLFYLYRQLQRQADELQQHAEEIARKNLQIEAASRMKSEFLASMSHELRTPLNAIIGFSEILKDGVVGKLSKKQNNYITEIFLSGEHLLALINDILDLSKVETGKMTLDLEVVEVASLLQASLNVVREKAYKHGIKLKLDLPDDAGRLMGDARKLKQIVYNLLSNAVKFTPDGGEVRLSSRAVGRDALMLAATRTGGIRQLPLPESEFEEFLEIKVCDTGIGIAAADLPRLFQAFLQLDSTLVRKTEGTGLGLALVNRLAELHGGTVAVASTPSQGSCFVVWLPWREVKETTELSAQGISLAPGATSARPQQQGHAPQPVPKDPIRRALIIEDDEWTTEILRTHLEDAGFRVTSASDAAHGLALAAQERPDVITLDLLMPNIHGWEALDRLKADPVLSSVPVVIVSIDADETRGFVLGAAKVLQKPVAGKVLRAAIAELGLTDETRGQVVVLVVGLDSAAVNRIQSSLRGLGFRVLRACGNDAVKKVQEVRPDLVILDLNMSDESGFGIAEGLRSCQDTAEVPLLIVTSRVSSATGRSRLKSHESTVMRKANFAPERLLSEVKRALSARGPCG
ncbi:MAG: response regulator [Gammaproteobacteria bacterium]|nr:response regulator [Gammaproteobacteria bacterium]